MSDKSTMTWTDDRGREHAREVNHLIDIRNFLGTPGYALLLVAANTNLSVGDLERWLNHIIAPKFPKARRSDSWLKRRRWMFQQLGTINACSRPNRDGKDERARKIMREHPRLSVRKLAHVLRKEYGIRRSSEWVRQHRCD
jgi:hypothetical protein